MKNSYKNQHLSDCYFSTRDIFTIASLSCMGAVTSVLLSQYGAVILGVIGVPGGTQFLAGLHIFWLVLAAVVVPKRGAATAAGLLKGTLELMLGNRHGLPVFLISVVAGLVVDVVLWVFPSNKKKIAMLVGAALAAGSNVVCFQLIARLPAHRLTVGILAIAVSIAGTSGVVFGGLLVLSVLRPLRRAGVISRTLLDDMP